MSMTKEERLIYQREYRKKNGNLCTNKYEKTVNGFLMRKYRNMLSRVTGVQHKKYHLYKDLQILPRETFYAWASDCKEFWQMWDNYLTSGFDRKLCPSVDRVDSYGGYTLDNMQWLTHSENSKKVTRKNANQ